MDIAERMKAYEEASRPTFPRRIPILLRVDGKTFHTLTSDCARPFDHDLMEAMDAVALALVSQVQGSQLAYVQSDEVSVLVHGYRTIHSQPWLGGDVQKMASIAASEATVAFNSVFKKWNRAGRFDARVFLVPESDVCNYFIWRQQDASRNSVHMVARAHFSHREIGSRTTSEMQELLWQQKKINWNDFPTSCKRGRCAVRRTFERDGAERSEWRMDQEIPLFTADRPYVEQYLETAEDEDTEQPTGTGLAT